MRVAIAIRIDALDVENASRCRPAAAEVGRTARLGEGGLGRRRGRPRRWFGILAAPDGAQSECEGAQPADVTTSCPAGSPSAPAAVNTIS
jgi:hypothetical protein